MLSFRKHSFPVVLLLSLFLSGCCLSHQWQEATCTAPKTCVKCGKAEDAMLPHNWQSANCSTPKTCKACGLTEGEVLEHTWQEATCETPETCIICGATQGEALSHTEGETEVESVDYINAMLTLECHCLRCRNVMSTREEKMKVLHEDGRFMMSPQDFVHRLNNAFAQIPGANLRAERISNNGALVITLSSENINIGHFVLYDTSFKETDGYMISPDKASSPFCYDFVMGGIEPDSVLTFYVIVATVMACDPAMDLDENAAKLEEAVAGILTNSSYECNGITYAFLDSVDEDYWVFMFGFGELL